MTHARARWVRYWRNRAAELHALGIPEPMIIDQIKREKLYATMRVWRAERSVTRAARVLGVSRRMVNVRLLWWKRRGYASRDYPVEAWFDSSAAAALVQEWKPEAAMAEYYGEA